MQYLLPEDFPYGRRWSLKLASSRGEKDRPSFPELLIAGKWDKLGLRDARPSSVRFRQWIDLQRGFRTWPVIRALTALWPLGGSLRP